jgi:phage shock protein PspC (stress-responsive transcriptional regulator)
MNKTININLGGLFFHIDEIAYQKLNRYLSAIRKSLSDDPQGRDEIIKDIELRISELLSIKIVDERQVISEGSIDSIIEVMGQPEDYNVDEELFTEPKTYTRKTKNSKKLYRDDDDKFLGGVAAGTAHYVGIEPIWSRIFWLILAFVFGFGFLIYPLLWILLPKAETTAEKLEMEGETVNIDNIERKIREEFGAVSDKIREGANEVSGKIKDNANEISDKIKKKYARKSKSGLQEFLDTLGQVLITLLKIFTKFIGVLIIFVSALVLLSLIIGMFSVGSLEFLGFGDDFRQYPAVIFNSYFPYWLILLLFFTTVAIPVVVLFMLGLKILSNNTKSFGKVTSLTLLALWILSILGLVFSGIDFASKYRYQGIDTQTNSIELIVNDTLNISMVGNDTYQDTKYLKHESNFNIVNVDGIEKVYSTNVDFDIRKSNTDLAYIKIRKEAKGRNYENANSNAEKLEYQFNVSDSNLKLNGYFLNEIKNTFFNQEIDVILYLPEGATIYLDKSTKTFIDDISNEQNIYDRRMINHYYIMGNSELKCIDCDEWNSNREKEDENLNLKIDNDGVNLKIKSDDGDVELKVNKNGLTIK